MRLRRRQPLVVALIVLWLAAVGYTAGPDRQQPGAPPEPGKPAPGETAGQAQPDEAPGDVPEVQFETHTLPNGLELILHVDRTLPIVHVNQWFHVGSKNEKPGRTGFAHLFEHMMFQGSKNAPGEYFTHIEQAGANVFEGGVNGTTSNDRTNYFATVPSANLEFLLWLESDRLATLLEVTTQEKLDNQRDVVKNERRQGLENQPYGRWYELLFGAVFPEGHPYSWPVIGSMDDLTAATLDDVKEFFARYYAPNNLSMVIAGDFDPAEANRLVEKYFGPIPPGPALDRPARWVSELTSEKVVEVNDRVPQERVYIGWPAPAYFADDDAALAIAARVLADGLASRLNKALVYDRPLCTAVNAFPISNEIGGLFVVMATARPDASLPEIEEVITGEIAKLAEEGPSAAELERAKTKQEFDFISGLERIGGFGGKADLLNQYNVYLGDPGMVEEDLQRFRTLSEADVRAAVDRWLNTRNRALVRFHPEPSSRPAETTLDRSMMPDLGADRPFTAPDVQTATLENGLEIYLVEREGLPKTAVVLATRAGATADPSGKDGLASIVVRTIDMGTERRRALEIETALGDLGTSLGGSAAREYAYLTFQVLQRNLGPALGIVADVVQHATFPASEVDRERKRQLDAIAQQEKSPNATAARVRAMLAFGRDHPYGRPSQGLTETVESIARDEVAAFHGKHWKPASSALIFVGDLRLAEATAVAREHFGGWSGGAAPAVEVPAPRRAEGGRIYLVDRPDSAQTIVTQILPAPPRETEDYYPLLLADAVWGGGGFGTRLNLNLREDKGYSYGVFSTLALFRESGYWYASGGVQTDRTKESVVEFRRELAALTDARPVTEEELTAAKLRKTRGYAQEFEAYGRVAGRIAELWAEQLPMSELQREYDATAAVSLPEALAAAEKYAVPGDAVLLLVGDRAKIEPGLRELELGEIVVIDAEGKPAAGPAKPTSARR